MVNRDGPRSVGPVRDTDERGQLVLLGGVVIAVMIVGLVIVFNSALFTENIDKGGASQSARDGAEFATELQRNARSLTLRVDHARKYSGGSPGAIQSRLQAAIDDNVTAYDRALSAAYARSGSASVNVSVDHAASTLGYRVVQDRDAAFTDPGGGDDWQVVDASTDVGWLVLNLNASELSSSDYFEVRLTNASGETMTVGFRRNASGGVDVRTALSTTGPASSTVTCVPTRGRLLVDVLGGNVYGRSCSFNATEHLAPPYTSVEFRNGSAAAGQYELVAEQGGSLAASVGPDGGPDYCTSSAPSADECWTYVYWTLHVSVTYESPQSTYDGNWTVEVYNATHGPA